MGTDPPSPRVGARPGASFACRDRPHPGSSWARPGFSDIRRSTTLYSQLEDGGGRITDMAARLGVTKQAVTLMVDHLEARGYVVRVADP